ncbi:MAG: RluA family pseudouridine synthase [Spirochaetales bacterium]
MSHTFDRSHVPFSAERMRAQRIPVLYRDEHVAVVDKPAGLMVHPNAWDRRAPNLINMLGGSLHSRVRTVHRLDRRTSGAMVVALSKDGAAELSRQLKAGEVQKRYIAVVRGHTDERGLIDRPLTKSDEGTPLPARTEFERIADSVIHVPVGRYEQAWFSLLRLTLHTGKRHQARRHLHYITHPIIGDPQHGDREWNEFAASRVGTSRLYLRAWQLSFLLPGDGRPITVQAGLPASWLAGCRALGLHPPDAAVGAWVSVDDEELFSGSASEPTRDFEIDDNNK